MSEDKEVTWAEIWGRLFFIILAGCAFAGGLVRFLEMFPALKGAFK